MANICLMAKENYSSSDEDEQVYDLYTFDELQNAFEELSSRYIALKKKFSKLKTKVKALESENEFILNEKCALKKSVNDFALIAVKLTKGKKNLEKLLGSQRQSLSKHGLGYAPFTKRKFSKTVFVKQGFLKDDTCSYCGINGHHAYSYNLKKSRFVRVKRIWVPKGKILPKLVVTNQKRPIKV